MIWLQNLSKEYGSRGSGKKVFENVNLVIPSGICVGVLGAQGSGKSTLLKLIAGAELPSEGSVAVDGSLLWQGSIGVAVHGKMTLRQNLRFLCRLHTLDDREMEEMVEKILELSNLQDRRDWIWREIPATDRALLSFAVMIVLKTDHLLIDGGLTKKKNRKIEEAMVQKIRRCSTIFVNRNLKSLRKYCDSGIVIDQKQLHYFEDIGDAIKFYRESEKKR